MSRGFAKLFGEASNQILVKLDVNDVNGDENPEVRVYFQPPELGVCSFALSWKDDSDKSWDLAEAAFDKFDEAYVRTLVEEQLQNIYKMTKEPR